MGKQNKNRKTKPVFYVFCEGETEENYISILRQHFRIPIEIKISKKSNISTRIIKSEFKYSSNFKKNLGDKIFLIYDLDQKDILNKLKIIQQEIKNMDVILLSSNPCIELWFLLHFKEQKSSITTNNLLQQLKKTFPNYKKGHLFNQESLLSNYPQAIERAKKLTDFKNPSSSLYELLKLLKQYNNE